MILTCPSRWWVISRSLEQVKWNKISRLLRKSKTQSYKAKPDSYLQKSSPLSKEVYYCTTKKATGLLKSWTNTEECMINPTWVWEKARVGWFKRTASKHVYYLGWNRSPAQVGSMRQALGPGALGRPRGTGWIGRWVGGSGWGTHVNPWLIHFNVRQNPLQ